MAVYFMFGGFMVALLTAMAYAVLYIVARAAKISKEHIEKAFLIYPLLWFFYTWVNALWGVNIYSGNSESVHAVLANLFIFGTPTYFLVGSVYTYIRKLWKFFVAYMVLGGGLILTWIIKSQF